MIVDYDTGLLFIEPKNKESKEPVIDSYTRRMTAAIRKAKRGAWVRCDRFEENNGWKGMHVCVCDAMSSSQDFMLENGIVTNSLAVHYLAMHRNEVPELELRKVALLPDEEAEPTSEEMSPKKIVWGNRGYRDGR